MLDWTILIIWNHSLPQTNAKTVSPGTSKLLPSKRVPINHPAAQGYIDQTTDSVVKINHKWILWTEIYMIVPSPGIVYRNPFYYMSIFEQGFKEFALQWVWCHKVRKSWIINKVEMCKLPWTSVWVNIRGVQNTKSGSVYVLDRLCLLQTTLV